MVVLKEIFWIYKIDLRLLDLILWHPQKSCHLKEDVIFAFGDESDVIKINKSPDLEAQGDEVHNIEMFHSGNKIVVARFDNRIIGYTWAVFKRKSTFDKWFNLKTNEFMAMRGFTHGDFRNKGVHTCLMNYLNKHIKDLGFTKMITEISTVNYANLKSTKNLGTKSTGSYYLHLHFLFWDFVFPFGQLRKRFSKKIRRSDRT
jgi:GNAT superfamily N-acetyltransferase